MAPLRPQNVYNAPTTGLRRRGHRCILASGLEEGWRTGIRWQAWVSVRLNQARFRRAVLASYGQRCCITGLSEPRLLVASHIVPWAEDTRNRLNPHNGLCLSALHDRAFDLGLITVTPGSLQVRVSERLRASVRDGFGLKALVALDGQPIRPPERYRPDDAFLGWHGRRFGFG
jgi:putative restriction endonuclease